MATNELCSKEGIFEAQEFRQSTTRHKLLAKRSRGIPRHQDEIARPTMGERRRKYLVA